MKRRPGLSFGNVKKISYLSIIAYNPAILCGPALPVSLFLPLQNYFRLNFCIAEKISLWGCMDRTFLFFLIYY